MATEPQYLGFIRLGAGAGCPCVEAGERLLTIRKHQHRWESLLGSGEGPGPKQNFLAQVASGPLWEPKPDYGFGGVIIDQRIGRYTGLVSGPKKLWPQGDIGVYVVVTQTPILTTWKHLFFSSFGAGAVQLSDEYSLAALREDIDSIVSDPTAGIAAVPWGSAAVGGYHELSRGGGDYRPDGTPAIGVGQWSWLGLGPVSGTPGQVVIERDEKVWSRGGSVMEIRSTLEWSVHLSRQVAQIRHRGLFSTEEFIRVTRSGEPTGDEVVLGRTFWEIRRGILQVISPPISDVDGDATDHRFERGYRVRLGDAGMAGEPVLEWIGVGTSVGGC
jgi:hypothetical protein